MTIVEWRGGTAVVDGETLSVIPESTFERVSKLLKKPAPVVRSVEIPIDEGGGIEERLVDVAPGEPGHAAAALRKLPGARVVVDMEA